MFSGSEVLATALKTKLEEAGIEPTRRGETLSIQEFGKLANCLHPNFCVRQ